MEALSIKAGSAFLLSLLGSPHCLGMCGGFALGLCGGKKTGLGTRMGRQLLWSSGRTFTYVFLGAVAGATGMALGGTPLLGSLQSAVGWVAGIAMVILGLFHLRVLRWPASASTKAPSGWARLVGQLSISQQTWAPFGLGVMTGFIPCGMVYAAAVMASTAGSVPGSMAVMAAFGAGTFPALFGLGLAGIAVRAKARLRFQQAAGVLTIAMGLMFMVRAPVAPTSADEEVACPLCETGTGAMEANSHE